MLRCPTPSRTTRLLNLLPLSQPPRLDELPVDVDGVVDVQQEPLAAIEKAQAQKVVVDECCQRIEHRVPDERGPGAACAAPGVEKVRDLGAVAVHVLEIDAHGGI